MTKKSLILAGALALSSLAIAGAKAYDITLSSPTKAGNVDLRVGEYKVKVEGANAVFTNVDTSEKFTVPCKVDSAGKKHDYTAIESKKQNGTENLKAIQLGGSDETLEFGE